MVPAVKVWFHRSRSIVWGISLIPAILWWQTSILFVIVASVYNNVVSDWAASEAADDSVVTEQMEALEKRLEQKMDQMEKRILRAIGEAVEGVEAST